MYYVGTMLGGLKYPTHRRVHIASPRRQVPVSQPQSAASDALESSGAVGPRRNVPQSVPPKCMAQCAQQVTAGMNLAARWLSRMKKRGFPKENDRKDAGWPTL